MRTWFVCAALAASLFVGRGNPIAAQGNGGTIPGWVLDARDQSPVAFALIRLSSADSAGTTVAAVLTDSGGRYVIAGVPAGTYRLQVDRIGFERIASPP